MRRPTIPRRKSEWQVHKQIWLTNEPRTRYVPARITLARGMSRRMIRDTQVICSDQVEEHDDDLASGGVTCGRRPAERTSVPLQRLCNAALSTPAFT
jgi:hypothetical protein